MRVSLRVLVACCGIVCILPSVAAAAQKNCTPEPTDEPIFYGDVIGCQTHGGDAGDFFRFNATAGDHVRIVMTQLAGGDVGASPCFKLFAPSGAQLFSNCGFSGVSDERTVTETGSYTIVTHDALFDNAMNSSIELVCLSGTCAVGQAVCDVELNQATYINGDVVTASRFRFANNGLTSLATEIKLWLAIPGFAPFGLVNVGADGSIALPASFSSDSAPVALFPVTAAFPRGSYELSCRVLDPLTGRLLSEDRNVFVIQ